MSKVLERQGVAKKKASYEKMMDNLVLQYKDDPRIGEGYDWRAPPKTAPFKKKPKLDKPDKGINPDDYEMKVINGAGDMRMMPKINLPPFQWGKKCSCGIVHSEDKNRYGYLGDYKSSWGPYMSIPERSDKDVPIEERLTNAQINEINAGAIASMGTWESYKARFHVDNRKRKRA